MYFLDEITDYETDDGNGKKHKYQKRVRTKRTKPSVPFSLMMFQDLARLYCLKDNQLKVLIKIVSCMDYDNIVRVSGYDRKEWSKELNLTYNTISVALTKLKSAGLILSLGGGAYQIDPEVFNMGNLSTAIEKTEKYNAFFKISYTNGNDGVKKKIKMLKVECDDDSETEEVY